MVKADTRLHRVQTVEADLVRKPIAGYVVGVFDRQVVRFVFVVAETKDQLGAISNLPLILDEIRMDIARIHRGRIVRVPRV